jgi:hypothetical protein
VDKGRIAGGSRVSNAMTAASAARKAISVALLAATTVWVINTSGVMGVPGYSVPA